MPSPSVNSVDLPVEIFGGKVSQFDPQKLPQGASPFCQDVIFSGLNPSGTSEVAGVATRPGMQSVYAAFAGNPTVNYIRTFVDLLGNFRQMILDGLGNMYQEFPLSTLAVIGKVVAGAFAQSDTYGGREWMAVGDGQYGLDIPRQWDGTNFDRVSQVGPGASPTVVDGAAGNISAGLHEVACCFVLRSGYITAPSIPSSWTAGGAKKVNLTNIATGPPNVTQRIVIFTPVITPPATAGPFFYFSSITGSGALTFPSMVIPDNTTTTATFDFLDSVLQAATAATNLFNLLELGECSSVIAYSDRLFWGGERNKVHAAGGGGGFNNLTFDGGFTSPVAITTTAFTAPTAAADAGGGAAAWANPANIEALDGVYATCLMPNRASAFNPAILSNFINATGFGFAVPAGAVIQGITVQVYLKGSDPFGQVDNIVQLLVGGVRSGANRAAGTTLSTAIGLNTYGGSSDQWGLALTPAVVNSANFGVSFQGGNLDVSGPGGTISIDFMAISVSYIVPGAAQTPLGWTAGASYAGGDSALHANRTPYYGDAFSITGDGATAIRGQMNQVAFQDYLGIPQIAINTAYGVRARIASANGLVAGTVHINLQSTSGAFTTTGLAIPAGMLSATYVEFIAPIFSSLPAIPSDLVLQVYADGTPTNGGVFLIDCIEIYPLNQPINRTILRCSYASNPESFDVLTGFMIYGNNNGQSIRCEKQLLDNKLYVLKEHSMYVTNDDGQNEPSLWTISTVSETVGTLSNHGADVGEAWFIIYDHAGAYMFAGADPVKISQEIQPDWDTINWSAGQFGYVSVDTARRRVHIGAPTGTSTIPNIEFVMDFAQLSDASDIISHPQAYYSLYQPTKVIAPGRARKWTLWNLFSGLGANCAALIRRLDGSYHLLRGNASSSGKVYDQLTSQLSDDGIAIASTYQTFFLPEAEQEIASQLGAYRKFYKWLSGYVWGAGFMFFTISGPQGQRQKSLTTLALRSVDHWDFNMNIDWVGERASFIFGTAAAGSWFSLTKLCPAVQRELFTTVRGNA